MTNREWFIQDIVEQISKDDKLLRQLNLNLGPKPFWCDPDKTAQTRNNRIGLCDGNCDRCFKEWGDMEHKENNKN